MKRFVLDASVALGWIIDRPAPAEHARQVLLQGGRAVVPSLFHLEVANGLAVAVRRRILDRRDTDEGLQLLERLIAQAVETESELVSAREALTTARVFGVSAYDGIYLELARRLELPFATVDKPLRAAATKAGVELLR